jgi:hypothetical protein
MLTIEQKIDILLDRQICHTRFTSVTVPADNTQGLPIGQGACKAVILKLNRYVFNSTNGTEQGVEQMYIGDAQAQDWELERGRSSDIIFCKDLNEVFVRVPSGEVALVQILMYI